jgi:hypothetical protein
MLCLGTNLPVERLLKGDMLSIKSTVTVQISYVTASLQNEIHCFPISFSRECPSLIASNPPLIRSKCLSLRKII